MRNYVCLPTQTVYGMLFEANRKCPRFLGGAEFEVPFPPTDTTGDFDAGAAGDFFCGTDVGNDIGVTGADGGFVTVVLAKPCFTRAGDGTCGVSTPPFGSRLIGLPERRSVGTFNGSGGGATEARSQTKAPRQS